MGEIIVFPKRKVRRIKWRPGAYAAAPFVPPSNPMTPSQLDPMAMLACARVYADAYPVVFAFSWAERERYAP
jgi:hypothetical protein